MRCTAAQGMPASREHRDHDTFGRRSDPDGKAKHHAGMLGLIRFRTDTVGALPTHLTSRRCSRVGPAQSGGLQKHTPPNEPRTDWARVHRRQDRADEPQRLCLARRLMAHAGEVCCASQRIWRPMSQSGQIRSFRDVRLNVRFTRKRVLALTCTTARQCAKC
jgi:hypothetical protein